MPIFKAPTGETTASRIKTLVLFVERTRTRLEADELLGEIGVTRDILMDETRMVSVAIWRRALEQFARRLGQGAIAETTRDVVHPSNLGPWIHVVRNADTVADGYRLLEGTSTQMSSTTRIETVRVGREYWRGRVVVLHDPSLEHDGLLGLARKAEIAAVPILFGFAQAAVLEVATLERDGFYEYEARWVEDTVGVVRWLVLAATTSSFAVVGYFAFRWSGALVMAVIGAATGMIALRLYVIEHHRRAQVHTQSMRIRALERSLELQEAPEPGPAGDLDGQVIAGLYRLHARLGSGATGVIYEAMRLSDRATVAVKLLRAAVAQDSVASDRLSREAEALRLTWHGNVVELYDHGHLPDGSSYLVMELLRGESLATRVQKIKRFQPKELLPILAQICDALTAIHAAGVVHRDLKPSNIFLVDPVTNLRSSSAWVAKDPNAPRVKIFDFGIARVEWAETRITNIGVPLGTPGYMSPEQENGDIIDHRTDIYALGALIYECLTGNPPPLARKAATEGGTSAVPGKWELVPLTGFGAGAESIDSRWKTLVERAMALRPDDRFSDARSMLLAIEAIGRGSSIPPPSLRARDP